MMEDRSTSSRIIIHSRTQSPLNKSSAKTLHTIRDSGQAISSFRGIMPGNLKAIQKRERNDKYFRETFFGHSKADSIKNTPSKHFAKYERDDVEAYKINAGSLPRLIFGKNETLTDWKVTFDLKAKAAAHSRTPSSNSLQFALPFSIQCLEMGIPSVHFLNKDYSEKLFSALKHEVPGAFIASVKYHAIETAVHEWFAEKATESKSDRTTETKDLISLLYSLLYFHLHPVSKPYARTLATTFGLWIELNQFQERDFEKIQNQLKSKHVLEFAKLEDKLTKELKSKDEIIEKLSISLEEAKSQIEKLELDIKDKNDFEFRMTEQVAKFHGLAKMMKEKAKVYKQRYLRAMQRNISLKVTEGHHREELAVRQIRGLSFGEEILSSKLPSRKKDHKFHAISTAATPTFPKRKKKAEILEEGLMVSISEDDEDMVKQYQQGMEEFNLTMGRLDNLCVEFNMLPDGKKFIAHQSTQTDPMVHKSCQTDLNTVGEKYNKVLLNQATLDTAVNDIELRDQIWKNPDVDFLQKFLKQSDEDLNDTTNLLPSYLTEEIKSFMRNEKRGESPFNIPELKSEIEELRSRQSPFYWKTLESYTLKVITNQDLLAERKILKRAREKLTKDKLGLEVKVASLEQTLKSKDILLQKINQKFSSDALPHKDVCLKLLKEAYEEKEPEENKGGLEKSSNSKSNQEGKPKGVIQSKAKFVVNQKKRAALGIIENVKGSKEKKGRYYVPVKQTLKTITAIYHERLKDFRMRQTKNDQLFAEFVYDYFVKSFGFISIAEPKLLSFIISLKNNRDKPRISLFSKFIGLDPNEEYSIEDLNKYIEALDFIGATSAGMNSVTNSEMDVEHIASYLRCIEYLKKFGEELNLPLSELTELRKDLDKLKKEQSQSSGKGAVVNVDIFLEQIVVKYRAIISLTKQSVINAFLACDLDGNQFVSEVEFITLWKHINPESFDQERGEQIFASRADKEDAGDVCMTFDRFCGVSAEYGLFSEERQLIFIEVFSKQGCKEKFKELKLAWPKLKHACKAALTEIGEGALSMDWEYIIETLDDRLLKCDEKEMPALLISAKMLESEVFREIKDLGKNEILDKFMKLSVFKHDKPN